MFGKESTVQASPLIFCGLYVVRFVGRTSTLKNTGLFGVLVKTGARKRMVYLPEFPQEISQPSVHACMPGVALLFAEWEPWLLWKWITSYFSFAESFEGHSRLSFGWSARKGSKHQRIGSLWMTATLFWKVWCWQDLSQSDSDGK